MLIKLNFNTGKSIAQLWRIVAEIINQPTVTSVSALNTLATNNGWNIDILQYLDTATSYIYRTKDTTGVTAHMARPSVASGGAAFDMVIEFPTYDISSAKQYIRMYSNATSGNSVNEMYGTSINAAMSSSGWLMSAASSGTSSQGTLIGIGGTATATRTVMNSTSAIYTIWVYITPYSMVWTCVMSGAFQPSGWFGTNSSYSSGTTYSGIDIYSQYKRYDYWNTASNTIAPFVFMNTNSNSVGFLTNTSELGIVNTNSATSTEGPLMMYNYISATPGTGTSFPVQYSARVALGVGTRYSDTFALTSSASSSTNATDTCYGAIVNTSTVQTRIPSTDLLSKGFSILPLTFRNMNLSILGGSISDVGDFYLFNGDYFPGDEFSYNNRTYVIFPVGLGYTTRLGLAIPKE